MADERQEFSFSQNDLGILSTEEVDPISIGENFLNSNPDDLKFVGRELEEKKKKEKEELDRKKQEKEKGKETKEVKEVIVPSREIGEDDLLDNIDKEDDDDIEETPPANKKVKTAGQKLADDKEERVVETQEGKEEEEANVYSTIAQEMLNHGIFTPETDDQGNELELDIDTPEKLLAKFEQDSRKRVADVIDKFLARYGDDYKDMFDNVFVKGVSPAEYLGRYTKIENLSKLDLTNEDNQERVVRELYRTEGRSSEYIEKRILQHKNYSDLADEATEAQRILIDREKKANEDSANQKQAEITRRQQIRNDYVTSVNKIITEKLKTKDFDGIPIDRKFAEQTFSYITQDKFQSGNQLLTEFDKDILDLARPENHELKVKVAMLLQMAKEDPQLTKLAKRAVTKETNQLFQGLNKKGLREKNNGKENQEKKEGQPQSWFATQ